VNTKTGARSKKTIDFIVSGLFAALQTIPRIWGFRMKTAIGVTLDPFPHPKHRKRRHETNAGG